MENINNYLLILAGLIAFFAVVVVYLKFNYQRFTNVEDSLSPIQVVKPFNKDYLYTNFQDVQKEDTRYKWNYLPPANPVVNRSVRQTFVPASAGLSFCEENNSNLLEYSGGTSQLLSLPLQFNEPNNEMLRSYDVLVTDYNRIKYGWKK